MDHTEETQPDDQDARLAQANKLFQLGVLLIHGPRKSVDKAIKCCQKAITVNDSDHRYWQILGEAYYQRGSFNPAINSFLRSLKLTEDLEPQDETERTKLQAHRTYSKLRMSDIRLSVSHLEEAIRGYCDIVVDDPKNVAALIGFSKTQLQLARNRFSSGLLEIGHLHCMSALEFALKAVKLSPHLCLTWKLASDCCLIQFIHGQRQDFTTKVDVQFPGSDHDGLLVINRLTCIELAQQFLCKALAIDPFQNVGCLWHNLGISLYLKSLLVPAKPGQQRLKTTDESKNLLRRSLKCLFKALDCDRSNCQIRNSIGVVAFHLNYVNVAQNFIIKSIQINRSTSEIQFSNLGYIYLSKSEFELARVAFARCQAEEPLYCRSWLSSGSIDYKSNASNIIFLRHCYRFEKDFQSEVMHATKVTTLPHSKEHHKDLDSAIECMQRMADYNESLLEVNNTLSLLYERCGFENEAKLCVQAGGTLAIQLLSN